MAKTVYVRGTKTQTIIDLAKRKSGVSGSEIVESTGWPAGSAKWRVEHIAATYGLHSVRLVRGDGTVAYRMASKAPQPVAKAPTKTTAKAPQKSAAKTNKAPTLAKAA